MEAQVRMTGTSADQPSVVVLGGGYGGINVAKGGQPLLPLILSRSKIGFVR